MGVPRSGHSDGHDDDERRRDREPASLGGAGGGGGHEHHHDDGERPERPGADELRETEAQPEGRSSDQLPVGANEKPGGEHERSRREQHRQRLGMKHRRALQDDRADDEEDDRREVEHVPTGPEKPDEHEEEHHGRGGRKAVEHLRRALPRVEVEPHRELDADPAHGEEARRRVVAARAVGKPAVLDDALGVIERLAGVVAQHRRVDDRIAHSDERRRCDHAVDRCSRRCDRANPLRALDETVLASCGRSSTAR